MTIKDIEFKLKDGRTAILRSANEKDAKAFIEMCIRDRAMEARCYNGGEGRTKMKPLVYAKDDKIAYLFLFAFLAVVIVLRILLPVNLGNLIFR